MSLCTQCERSKNKLEIELVGWRWILKEAEMICDDCWEENRNEKHTYTMSSIYRGLQSSDKLLSRDSCFDTSIQIKNWILNEGVGNGSLCKYQGNAAVDSSSLTTFWISSSGILPLHIYLTILFLSTIIIVYESSSNPHCFLNTASVSNKIVVSYFFAFLPAIFLMRKFLHLHFHLFHLHQVIREDLLSYNLS